MERKPLGYYNYTVVLTYIGMLIGFLGISCTLGGKISTALICLMLAGVCDMFDGTVAATMQRTDDERCFGIQIDSLSDLICFGLLPAIIVLKINENSEIAFPICGLYVLCALIRLAYFNVDEQNRQKQSTECRKYYSGLPVTTIAVILPLFLTLAGYLPVKKKIVGTITILIVAILFITPFRLKKPKAIGKIAMGIFGLLELVCLFMGLGDV